MLITARIALAFTEQSFWPAVTFARMRLARAGWSSPLFACSAHPAQRVTRTVPKPVNGATSGATTADSRECSGRSGVARLALFVLILAVAVLVGWKLGLFELRDRKALLGLVRRVRGVPLLAPAFVAAYAAAVTFGLPASLFTLAGGVLFGFWFGFLLNWLGATLGAVFAYTFASALCGDGCRGLLGRWAETLEEVATKHGLIGTLRLRLIPVVPFSLLNFGAALAGVRRRDYYIATALGIIPGTAVYTFFADSLLQGAAGAGRHALIRVAVAGAVLLLLSFVPAFVHRVRKH